MILVTVTGTYVHPDNTPAQGYVTFTPRPGTVTDSSVSDFMVGTTVTAELDNTGSFSAQVAASNDPDFAPTGWTYQITEVITGRPIRSYDVDLNSPGPINLVSLAPVPSVVGSLQLIPGPPGISSQTSTFLSGTGTFVVPASATVVMLEGVAGGGGGAAGSRVTGGNQTGGGGGGGGGKSLKLFSAAELRAAYPAGFSWTVGVGGTGAPANTTPGSVGADGGAGGFTFAGDFFVCTPGNLYGPAKGGSGPAGNDFGGIGGSSGLGDLQGSIGGCGGTWISFVTTNSITEAQGGIGGAQIIIFLNNALGGASYQLTAVQGGGGGAGGGGGGIYQTAGPVNHAGNGGSSGFAVSAAPSPIQGNGGVVGGVGPTTAGNASVLTSVQGGGGGGAASITGNGQNGANALANSGSGGGGGGASLTGNGGAGGNGGSGWLRITVW